MILKQKVQNLIEKSKIATRFSYVNVNFRIRDLKNCLEEFSKYVESDKKSKLDYKARIYSRTHRRREIENDIIKDLAYLDKFAKDNNIQMIYGRFTKEELEYNQFALENSFRRKDVLDFGLELIKVI